MIFLVVHRFEFLYVRNIRTSYPAGEGKPAFQMSNLISYLLSQRHVKASLTTSRPEVDLTGSGEAPQPHDHIRTECSECHTHKI